MSTPQNSCDAHTRPQRDTDVVRARSFRHPRRLALLAALVVVSLLGAGALWQSPLVRHKLKENMTGLGPSLRTSSGPGLPIANRLSYHKALPIANRLSYHKAPPIANRRRLTAAGSHCGSDKPRSDCDLVSWRPQATTRTSRFAALAA